MERSAQRRRRAFRPAWHSAAVGGVVLVGLVAAIVFSLLSEARYRSSASYAAVRTPAANLPRAVAAQKLVVTRTLAPGTADDVEIEAQPDGLVEVRAVSATSEGARKLANLYAAELMARDRGINRARLFRGMRRLEERIAKLRPGSRGRRRLERDLGRLQGRQIDDTKFQAATSARKLSGPDPVRHAAFALPVSVLLALMVGLALDRAGSRSSPRQRAEQSRLRLE